MRFIISKLKGKCSCCGKDTDLFSLDLDERICSDECFEKRRFEELQKELEK